jgi:hypothetical protein
MLVNFDSQLFEESLEGFENFSKKKKSETGQTNEKSKMWIVHELQFHFVGKLYLPPKTQMQWVFRQNESHCLFSISITDIY